MKSVKIQSILNNVPIFGHGFGKLNLPAFRNLKNAPIHIEKATEFVSVNPLCLIAPNKYFFLPINYVQYINFFLKRTLVYNFQKILTACKSKIKQLK